MTITQHAARSRLRGRAPTGLGNTDPVTAGTQHHASVPAAAAPRSPRPSSTASAAR